MRSISRRHQQESLRMLSTSVVALRTALVLPRRLTTPIQATPICPRDRALLFPVDRLRLKWVRSPSKSTFPNSLLIPKIRKARPTNISISTASSATGQEAQRSTEKSEDIQESGVTAQRTTLRLAI